MAIAQNLGFALLLISFIAMKLFFDDVFRWLRNLAILLLALGLLLFALVLFATSLAIWR